VPLAAALLPREAGGVATFCIYADWQPARQATDELLGVVGDGLLPTDDEACVWIDEQKPGVVQMSFDITGNGYDDAVEKARRLLDHVMSSAGASGKLTEVAAMDDEGQVVWTAE
jgi:hypothetical protein